MHKQSWFTYFFNVCRVFKRFSEAKKDWAPEHKDNTKGTHMIMVGMAQSLVTVCCALQLFHCWQGQRQLRQIRKSFRDCTLLVAEMLTCSWMQGGFLAVKGKEQGANFCFVEDFWGDSPSITRVSLTTPHAHPWQLPDSVRLVATAIVLHWLDGGMCTRRHA